MLTLFKKLTFFKKLTVLFMSAVLFGGAALFSVGAASAVTYHRASHKVGLTFKGGPGHAGPVWAGTWNNGERGFCLDFGKATPNRKGIKEISGKVPGMTAEESKQSKFIANKYADTGSREAAANAGIAIWRLQHDSAFNTWYRASRASGVISTPRHNKVDAIILDARQHGPYKMTITNTQVLVGQKGSGTVKARGSNGKPAVGRPVTVTATSARILTVNGVSGNRGTSRSTGVVFTYQRNAPGKISFRATLTSPSSAKAGVSRSSAGHQRTLSGGYRESSFQYNAYDTKAGQPDIDSACDTTCNGKSTVTFRFANPSGAQAIKWIEKVGTQVVATLSAQPGGPPGTAQAHLIDGTVLTSSSYCYTGSVLGGPCTSGTVVIPINREIVCPAWAQGELKRPCKCTPNLPGSVTLTSPASSPRFYRGFVSINKGTPTPTNLVNGKPAIFSTGKLAAGTNVVISFTVYRDAARTIQIGGTQVLRDITVN